jgi:hypothetical protein
MLIERKIASLTDMKRRLRTESTMTVFRALSRLGYASSYSHRGGYYTLSEIPEYDGLGLWSHGDVHFSLHGTLLRTAKALVTESVAGCTAAELEDKLHVETKHPLLRLTRRDELVRERVRGGNVYFSVEKGSGGFTRAWRLRSLAAAGLARSPRCWDWTLTRWPKVDRRSSMAK